MNILPGNKIHYKYSITIISCICGKYTIFPTLKKQISIQNCPCNRKDRTHRLLAAVSYQLRLQRQSPAHLHMYKHRNVYRHKMCINFTPSTDADEYRTWDLTWVSFIDALFSSYLALMPQTQTLVRQQIGKVKSRFELPGRGGTWLDWTPSVWSILELDAKKCSLQGQWSVSVFLHIMIELWRAKAAIIIDSKKRMHRSWLCCTAILKCDCFNGLCELFNTPAS